MGVEGAGNLTSAAAGARPNRIGQVDADRSAKDSGGMAGRDRVRRGSEGQDPDAVSRCLSHRIHPRR
ncbi:MAG: hypothetical protein ACJ790_05710 [Myxococcaceae bacterium]